MWGLPIRGNSNTLQVHSRLCADKECLQQQVVIDNLTDDALSRIQGRKRYRISCK